MEKILKNYYKFFIVFIYLRSSWEFPWENLPCVIAISVSFHFVENFKKKRRYLNLLKLFYFFKGENWVVNQTWFPFKKSVCSAAAKKGRNQVVNKERKVNKLGARDSMQAHVLNLEKNFK